MIKAIFSILAYGSKFASNNKIIKKTNGKKTVSGVIILLILGIVRRIFPDLISDELYWDINNFILYGWVACVGLLSKFIKWLKEKRNGDNRQQDN